jgi:NAD(P)H-hydrate epimerase
MYFLPAHAIRELDRATIDAGTPGVVLMERAGFGAFRFLTDVAVPHVARALVVSGKGNNAGDAFVVARYLSEKGCHVTLLLGADPETLQGDALYNCHRLKGLPIDVHIATDTDEADKTFALWHGDVIVDGVLGTGVRGEVEGLFRHLIELINAAQAPVCALDVPSGLDCDAGRPCGVAVEAEWTVTFAHPKQGMLTPSGAGRCGRVEVMDIGIDREWGRLRAEDGNDAIAALSGAEVRDLLPRRALGDHKNRFGHVLVIAGSRGMTGAAALAAQAALAAGAGLVTVAVPESLLGLVAPACPACMTLPVPDGGAGCFNASAADALAARLATYDAVALGPGLSRTETVRQFVSSLLPRIECACVIDADALNNIADEPELVSQLPVQTVLTPHPGEFARVAGAKPGDDTRARLEAAQTFANRHGCIIVLKGFQSIIAAPGGTPHINLSGNPGLATAGAGDVLTGLIASLAAQGVSVVGAARAGVYLHGLAADSAAGRESMASVTAPGVIAHLGAAYKYVGLI